MGKRHSLQDQIDTVAAKCATNSGWISRLRYEKRDLAIMIAVVAVNILVLVGIALYLYPRSTTYVGRQIVRLVPSDLEKTDDGQAARSPRYCAWFDKPARFHVVYKCGVAEVTSSNQFEPDATRYFSTVQHVKPMFMDSDSEFGMCFELFSLEHITNIELWCDGTTWLHAGEPEPIDYTLPLKLRKTGRYIVERKYENNG